MVDRFRVGVLHEIKASIYNFDKKIVSFLTGMEQGLDLGFLFNNVDTSNFIV